MCLETKARDYGGGDGDHGHDDCDDHGNARSEPCRPSMLHQ